MLPPDWGDILADVTEFYGWGPHDAWGLTWSRVEWWRGHMMRKRYGG